MASLSEEELSVVEDFINTEYEKKMALAKHPYLEKKLDEGQSEVDLERQYVAE